jgi:Methyltransferase domain
MIEHYWHTLPGPNWFSAPHIFAEQVARASDGALFVELGAWKGRSAAFMGVEIANSGKRIKFYSIDHWRGSLEEAPHREDEDVRRNRLYEVFLQNVSPLSEYVYPLRSDTAQAAARFEDLSIDFIYVDAGHSYSAVARDIRAWWPKLKVGGVMAGDDWRDVRRAVEDFFKWRGSEIIVRTGEPNAGWEQWLVQKDRQDSKKQLLLDRLHLAIRFGKKVAYKLAVREA